MQKKPILLIANFTDQSVLIVPLYERHVFLELTRFSIH